MLTRDERRMLHDAVCPRHRDTTPGVWVCHPCEAAGDAAVEDILASRQSALGAEHARLRQRVTAVLDRMRGRSVGCSSSDVADDIYDLARALACAPATDGPEEAVTYDFSDVSNAPTINGRPLPWHVSADRLPVLEPLRDEVHVLWVPVLVMAPMPSPAPVAEASGWAQRQERRGVPGRGLASVPDEIDGDES